MSPCFYMGYTGQLTPGADLPIQKNLAPCLRERQCCWGMPRLVRASAQHPAQRKQAPGAAAAGDKSWRKHEPSAPHEQTSPSRDDSECGYLNQDVALRVSPHRRAAVSSGSLWLMAELLSPGGDLVPPALDRQDRQLQEFLVG